MLNKTDVMVGDTVRVVPLGFLAQVDYNSNGVISGVYSLDEEGNVSYKLDSNVTAKLQKCNVVPSRVVNSKKCSVQGVFTYDLLSVSDMVCVGKDAYLKKIVSEFNLDDVSFYAYNLIDSKVTYGAYQQNTLLSMMGFKVCDSFVISSDVKKKSNLNNIPVMLKYPFVCGYSVLQRGNDFRYVPEYFTYSKVVSVSREVNHSGYILASVICLDEYEIRVHYPDVVKFNVQKGSYVIVDSGRIVYCSDRNNYSKKVEREFHCEFCGSLITSPVTGYLKCSYDNCTSNMYPQVENMLNVFGLEFLPYSDYISYVKSGYILSLSDVLDLERYKDTTVHCTVSDILKAVCPVSVVKDRSFFDKFVEFCKSVESVNYYISNPSDISKDMSSFLPYNMCKSFEQWIDNPENLLTVQTFMSMDNIHIKTNSVTLDVPKIFRNKTIYLEGKFRRGSYETVSSILRSYGADISAKFDNRSNCVIVGDLEKNIESIPVVDIALSYNIPVFTETAFFNSYGIDNDIEESHQ